MTIHLQVALILILNLLLIKHTNQSNSHDINDQQIIQEEPSDHQARIGEQVLLKCRIKNLKGEPQWCIDDFCLGVAKKHDTIGLTIRDKSTMNHTQQTLKGRPRHRIIGDKSKGEFHLLIEPIQLQDNMFYYCMATAASETIKAVKSKKVFLTVLTYPQSLNLDNPVHVSLNKPSSIQCSARQSRPPVKILIALNGNLITDESRYKTEIIQIPISMTTEDSSVEQQQTPIHINTTSIDQNKKILHFSPNQAVNLEQMRESFYDTITTLTVDDVTMKMDGQTVECFVYSFLHHLNDANNVVNKKIANYNLISFHNTMMNTKSYIQVDYAPEVSLKILSANKILKEEDVISLVCETKATPAIQSYKWYIGKNYLSGVGDSNLNLKLRREMHLKTVTCEASNTVASVKASIQLNILYKPSFVKGSKSFIQIEKNTCNKPLTLDCQVNSNPIGNITWYRRRINSNKIYQFDQKKLASLFSKIDLTKTNQESTYYYDELIGTGPTYTIASFNCANLLSNIKNITIDSTTKTINKQNITTLNEQLNKLKNNKLPARFRINSTNPISSQLKKLNLRNIDQEDENVDLDYTEYSNQEDYQSEDDTDHFDDDSYSTTQTNYNDYNDFGIYICEASNKLTPNENTISRRYIKLNPIGAPILKAIESNSISISSANSNNNDEIISELMKSTDGNLVEVAANLGASVSLVCIIEPLPQFDSIVWLNYQGKIVPNSKYSINEQTKNKLVSTSSEIKSNTNQNQRTIFRNFKVKYENLTLYSSKLNDLNDESLTNNEGDVNLMRSILFIKNLRQQDLGVYKCKSSNAYGSNTVSILLREKTLMDKFNLNNYLFLTLTTSSIAGILVVFIILMICLISRRARQLICCCCCCCCFRCAKRILKEKDLLGQQCEQNSDKSINEWLVSSKLSNDTANGSLINSSNGTTAINNNVSTTTAMSLLNQNDLSEHLIQTCNMNTLMNTLTNNLKANKIILNTPNHLRLELNGTALLTDDLDDDTDINLEKSHNRLFLTSEAISNSNNNNTFKRDSNANACYQSVSQFNRFLVSSPLLSTSSQKCDEDKTSDDTNNTSPSSASTALSKTLGPTMLIRSPPNFSAKISSCNSSVNDSKLEQQRLLNNSSTTSSTNAKNSTIKLNSFMFNRNFDKTIEKDYYENTNDVDFNDVDDLTKILQETNYRLSDMQETQYNFTDLFNELSPINNVNTNVNNNNSNKTNYHAMTTPNLSIKTNLKPNLFQQFPSLINASPPPPPPPPPNHPPNHSIQRQQNQSNFNKFPNPFTSSVSSSSPSQNQSNLTSASASKFYSNFYKNPNEQYENTTDSNSNKETDLKTPLSQTSVVAAASTSSIQHIITTSSTNGNNKYQTNV